MKYNQYNRFHIRVEYKYKYTIFYQDKKVFSVIILTLRYIDVINRIVSVLNSRESKKKLKYNKKT